MAIVFFDHADAGAHVLSQCVDADAPVEQSERGVGVSTAVEHPLTASSVCEHDSCFQRPFKQAPQVVMFHWLAVGQTEHRFSG